MLLKELVSKDVDINTEAFPGELAGVGQLGFFGNVWVRSHYMHKAGFTNGGGHTHNFDHVTLLAVGSVRVEVEGYESKEFVAPTFITVEKDHHHKFIALTDGVVYYCVFAMRDSDGEVIASPEHSGLGTPKAAH